MPHVPGSGEPVANGGADSAGGAAAHVAGYERRRMALLSSVGRLSLTCVSRLPQ